MKSILSSVSIEPISFIEDKNSLKIIFNDTFKNSGKQAGIIICEQILSLKYDVDFADSDDENFFPRFVGDIYLDEVSQNDFAALLNSQSYKGYIDTSCVNKIYHLLIEGSGIEISILFKNLVITRG